MIQNEYLTTAAPRRPLLDRRFGMNSLAFEIGLYGLLFVVSIFLHVWQLDVKAMHHDESIHAWMSYKFFNGIGPFSCAHAPGAPADQIPQSPTYCYDPVYHGPSLYVLTLISYFLFGVGDGQARLPMALAGIALVPMAWTLRSFIGRKGAFLAALLMTVSPSILYYTRFARHDALVLLWSLFMVVGLFKFIRDGGAANLALAAAGLALTWATHELVFILAFTGVSFLAFRLLWEWRPRVFLISMSITVVVGLSFVILETLSGDQSALNKLLGPMMMLGTGALLVLPMSYAWEPRPVVLERIVGTWRSERRVFWIAIGTFLAIFTLLFTTFLAYPRGFLDGWYRGLEYWLGSQQEYARGGQPWFYYLMLLPIYDLLAVIFGLIGVGWLVTAGLRRPAAQTSGSHDPATTLQNGNGHARVYAAENDNRSLITQPPLMVFFFGYWFILSLIAYSWAGEKMPWLVTHISLPATLLTAWVLAKLIERVPWRSLRHNYGWAAPLLSALVVVSIFVAAYMFGGGGATINDLRTRLGGLVPLIFTGLCLFGLLTIANTFGTRVVLRLAGLTLASVLLLYGIRSALRVNFYHPDTPDEPLIYTQTAPDVPILMRKIEQLAINHSRNERSPDDPTGALGLPILLDRGGSTNGNEGSVAWPMQWYLRDYKDVRWIDVDTNKTIDTSAAVVVLYKPHVTDDIRSQLDDYVLDMDGVFNWWFPEYRAAYNPDKPGEVSARGYKTLGTEAGVGGVLAWPFTPANWPALMRYMIYRDLPIPLDAREMQVFIRRDVAPGGGGAQANTTPTESLTPETVVPQGTLNGARGLAVDQTGNIYVADALNHRIVVFDPNGQQLRVIGSLGHGDGQLNEPSSVSVDSDGNIYVADTWNGRVVKFANNGTFIKAWGDANVPFMQPFTDGATGQTVQRYATDNDGDPQRNQAAPLGFFGPRDVRVVGDRVYVTDTGNSRVVVTDRDGNFVQQFGNLGTEPGRMHEPIGLGSDDRGRIYVGDTWNGRVQIFQPAADGQIDPNPVATVEVPGWLKDTYNDPYMAVAGDGTIYASQGPRNTLAQFDSSQKLARRLKGEPALNGPKGVALAADGVLYVVNGGQNDVVRLRLP